MYKFNVAHGGHGILPIHIGVVYTKRTPKSASCKIMNKVLGGKLVKVHLDDRVLYIAQGKFMKTLEERRDKMDDYLILDPFNRQESTDLLGINYFMGNFTGDKRLSSTSLRIIWDSGGLQIARGVRDFIDPKDIGNSLKENDIYAGVTLDFIPILGMVGYMKAIKIGSQLQKRNTARIREFSDGTQVLNVVHGYNQDARKLWFANTLNAKKDFCWCLSDFNRLPSLTDRAFLLCQDLNELSKAFDLKDVWAHVLGMATHKFVLVMLPMSLKLKEMTSDATSALVCANNGIMLLPSFNAVFPQMYIRKLPEIGIGMAPCSCPVCHIVKEPWVYGKFSIPLAYHNISVINGTVSHLSKILQCEGIDAYITFLRRYKTPERLIHIIEQSIEYIDNGKRPALSALTSMKESIGESFCLTTPPKEQILWDAFKKYVKFYRELDE